jgi:dTDP-4-amino-4,6-dideoxygalactose transaminase
MRVPLLDLKAQFAGHRSRVLEAIERVVESQRFIMGPEVEAFEKDIAAYCGTGSAIAMSSGTDALLAALMALEVGPGDEVVTTAYSFFATAGVVARLGAKPVFVDVEPNSLNLDPAAAVAAVTPNTKAMIPVHLFGRIAGMDPLLEAARRHGFAIVEDAAQALGATDPVSGRHAGTIGHIGCFSFFPAKNLGGYGDGGMAVTDDEELADALRIMRVHGAKPKYFHHTIGGNFRLDAIQAAVLRVKLDYLNSWGEARSRNAERYRSLFWDAGLTDVIGIPEDVPGHIYHQFIIQTNRRDALQAHLGEHGVGSAVYYPRTLPLQECFADLGHVEGDFPHAEAAARETLALPIYPELTSEQQEYVVEVIQAFFEG